MKVITVTNQKGGVGKTTTALNLAMGLQRKGYKVLAIDLDPQQGNLTQTVKADKTVYSMMEVLLEEDELQNVIQDTCIGLDLAAATEDMTAIDSRMAAIGSIAKERKLRDAVHALPEGMYDYVIVDTPPALGTLTLNALTAADYVLIVAEPDTNSMHGINKLHETMVEIKKYFNPDVKYCGILLTKTKANTNITKLMSEITRTIGEKIGAAVFNTTIRNSVTIPGAVAEFKDIWAFDKSCGAAQDYEALVEEVINRTEV